MGYCFEFTTNNESKIISHVHGIFDDQNRLKGKMECTNINCRIIGVIDRVKNLLFSCSVSLILRNSFLREKFTKSPGSFNRLFLNSLRIASTKKTSKFVGTKTI